MSGDAFVDFSGNQPIKLIILVLPFKYTNLLHLTILSEVQ